MRYETEEEMLRRQERERKERQRRDSGFVALGAAVGTVVDSAVDLALSPFNLFD